MKGEKLFGVLVLFFIFNGCSPQKSEQLLLDSFEGEISSDTVDFGAGPNSSIKVEASKQIKICGEQSLKVEYKLAPSSYMWVARGFNLDVKGANRWLVSPEEIDWRRYNAFSFYMYGQNSQGAVAFDIKDAKNEMWRFVVRDDFTGWKKIICSWDKFFSRQDWQPDNAYTDQVLDFPIISFQFEPRLVGEGVYYFDCVSLVRVGKKK